MPSQVFTEQAFALDAWVRLLRGHAAVIRAMSTQLEADHGLTINGYEALLHLARAEDGRLKRVELAQRLILTASGVTRLLDGLEEAGYVERGDCSSDRRVTYAVLTEDGRRKLEEASESHLSAVRTFFEERFSGEELEQLADLLGRLPNVADAVGEDCAA